MQTQSLRNKSRRSHHRKTGTDHEVEHPEKSNDSDPATSDSTQDKPERTGEQSRQSRPAPAEISDKEVLHTHLLMMAITPVNQLPSLDLKTIV